MVRYGSGLASCATRGVSMIGDSVELIFGCGILCWSVARGSCTRFFFAGFWRGKGHWTVCWYCVFRHLGFGVDLRGWCGFVVGKVGGEDPKARLEKIKKQLSAGSGTVLLQGPLLKRSETVSLLGIALVT